MNLQHFQAFLWLRWRLLVNQMRRGGSANAVIAVILAVFALIAACGLFVAFFLIGWLALPLAAPADKGGPDVFLWVWDGLIVAFLFAWMLGLIIELQRSEVLSLDKFLHLPVSLRGVFLINYLSSLFSFTMLLFLPSMVALALGLTVARGPAGLLALPALAAFLLMVTALTYQFQGWLASLMVNKRRRRTVIVLVTGFFILLCQAPNLVNFYFQGSHSPKQPSAAIVERSEQQAALEQAKGTLKDKDDEYIRRLQAIDEQYKKRVQEEDDQLLEQISVTVRWVNLAVPPGWLALGAAGAVNGEVWQPLLATLVMGLIGAASLWRAYRTTLRLYTGQYNAKRSAVAVKVEAAPIDKGGVAAAKPLLLEWQIPLVSEPAAAVALGGFRSLTRAPEAKMLLLTPFILLLVFASMSFARGINPPELTRPLIAYGGMSMMLLTMGQIVGNQFGFDRGGFRVFVLSAAPRRDILLGKNLAAAPLALGLATVAIAFVAVVYPMRRVDHLLALFPQLVTMYLLFCLLANCLSIIAPMPMRTGTLKPASVKLMPAVLQVVFALLFPLVLAPSLLPLAVEFVVGALTGLTWLPLYLVLSLLECVLVVFLYRLVLKPLGRLLQSRELRILETVTTKEE